MTRVRTSLPADRAPLSTRHRARAAAALVSTGGLLVGFGAVSASPAFAASAADCIDDGSGIDNTLTSAAGDDRDDIQGLLDSDVAIICLAGTFTIDETLIADSSTELYGLPAAVLTGVNTRIIEMVVDSPLVVENLTFQNGDAFDGRGGAIAGYGVTAIDSTFLDNSASEGGAIYGYGAVSVEGSTFVGNTADVYGGAISAGTSEVENSTFVSNDAGDEGGALFTGDSEVQFSTFLENTAPAPEPAAELPGDAIYLANDGDDNLAIRGNIFAGSTGNPQLGVGGTITSGRIVDFGGNVFTTDRDTESDLGVVDPSTLFEQTIAELFGAGAAPGANGGPTSTVALIAGSPAIDIVPPIAQFSSEPTSSELSPAAIGDVPVDQRGVERGEALDAGAFEFVPAAPELAATGAYSGAMGWVAALAALLLGAGAAIAAGTRRSARR